MFGFNKDGLSAHDLIAFAKAEKEVKKNPSLLFEKAAEVAKLVGRDEVFIPNKTMAAVSKSAARKAFPGEKFSAVCPYRAGSRLYYPPNLERQEVEKALGRLISREGNNTDSSIDYFDSCSRVNLGGVHINFEPPFIQEDEELLRGTSEEKKHEPITVMPKSFDHCARSVEPENDLQSVIEFESASKQHSKTKSEQADER